MMKLESLVAVHTHTHTHTHNTFYQTLIFLLVSICIPIKIMETQIKASKIVFY